jgi:tRNA threonylcarbamoyl adenosine modification protein YjeE
MQIVLPDADSTKRLGKAFGSSIKKDALIALAGPLGSGKTTFVQGLALGLGITEVVNSPTFTTLNEYHSGRLPLYHFDFYRLFDADSDAQARGKKNSLKEFLTIEINEIVENNGGNVVIAYEWANLFEPETFRVNEEKLLLTFEYTDDARQVILDTSSTKSANWAKKILENFC